MQLQKIGQRKIHLIYFDKQEATLKAVGFFIYE